MQPLTQTIDEELGYACGVYAYRSYPYMTTIELRREARRAYERACASMILVESDFVDSYVHGWNDMREGRV